MNKFRKEERLCSEKVISQLFQHGTSFYAFPFRVTYMITELKGNYPAQFSVSVSKRKFKLAVHRNRIKRLTRESYRLSKHQLYDKLRYNSSSLVFMMIYTQKVLPKYSEIDKAVNKIIDELSKIST